MTIKSYNPSTNTLLGEVQTSSKAEIVAAVGGARKALSEWKLIGVDGRTSALKKVALEFERRKKEFAQLSSQEMGMPISQSIHDVGGAIDYLNWYITNADRYLKPEVVYEDDSQVHEVHFEPVGVVAAITPWNFPASNFVWMVCQNLLVGNTVIFKDSEEVPLCGNLIEEIMATAQLPTGVFAEVYGDRKVGETLISQDIDMICFTGSTATGQKLYSIGAARFLRIFLELGGSAPGVVLKDADVDAVLDTIYANRFDNCGQICDGLKRLIVHESLMDELVTKLSEKIQSVTIGDALDKKTDVGPLVSKKQLKHLEDQVSDALSKGATEVYKKAIPKGKGNYYPPTLFANVTKDMKIWHEEVFGPVLPIVSFKTEEEAVNLANDTKYGLGGYVFTKDKQVFKRIASQIQTGMVQMNNTVYVQPSTPFGGCKHSGVGREHGRYGFHEVSNIKVIATEK